MVRLAECLCATLGEVEVQCVSSLSLDRWKGGIIRNLEDTEGFHEGDVYAVAHIHDNEVIIASCIFSGSGESTLRYRIEVLHCREGMADLTSNLRSSRSIDCRSDPKAGYNDNHSDQRIDRLAAATIL